MVHRQLAWLAYEGRVDEISTGDLLVKLFQAQQKRAVPESDRIGSSSRTAFGCYRIVPVTWASRLQPSTVSPCCKPEGGCVGTAVGLAG